MYQCFCVLISLWKFPQIFFVCSLQKPVGSHWFKKFCVSCLVFTSIYSFFIKWWKYYKAIFSTWISSTSAKLFFSQKYSWNIFDVLKCTSMDFFRLFGFWQESHRFYTSFFLKKLYIYNLSILLPTSHTAF